MTDEQEQAEGEPQQAPEEEGGPEPFDQNPPVNPSEPQVGNSRARFFMPREESEGHDEESEEGVEEEEEEEVREGDA
jgi:hypothetical protein